MIKRSINRLIKAFGYSIEGITSTFKNEQAFRQEVYLFPLAIILAFVFSENHIDLILLISSYVFILFAELINTAIENIVDRIGMEKHPLSKQAKDIGSAAVLIAIILCLFIWILIFLN